MNHSLSIRNAVYLKQRMVNKEELRQSIENQKSFIVEEQRCLNFCYENPDECDVEEMEARETYIGELLVELEKLEKLEKLNKII